VVILKDDRTDDGTARSVIRPMGGCTDGDTSVPGHFSICAELSIRHIGTGANVSRHFGTGDT